MSGLVWYETFSTGLKEIGFQINPYDMCVSNNQINNKHCTIVWYVDDVKVSHAEESVVESVMDEIKNRSDGLEIHRGRNQEYMGMKLKFNEDSTLNISMKQYIEEFIASSGMKIQIKATKPANRRLFEINKK